MPITSKPIFSTTSRMSCAERAVTDLFSMTSWICGRESGRNSTCLSACAFPNELHSNGAMPPSRPAAFSDLDDLHGIGAARGSDRFSKSDHDEIALFYQPGRHESVLGFLQERVTIMSDIFNHQRINIPEQAQAVTGRDLGCKRVNRHAAVEPRNPQRRRT